MLGLRLGHSVEVARALYQYVMHVACIAMIYLPKSVVRALVSSAVLRLCVKGYAASVPTCVIELFALPVIGLRHGTAVQGTDVVCSSVVLHLR